MADKHININFPFENSPKGFYLDLNVTNSDAIKADLMHLILTDKGERLYLPDFGTNLRKYLFEPMDGITEDDIRTEISDAVRKYIPNLNITGLTITESELSQYGVTVKLNYVVSDDVFETKDSVTINL